MLLINIRSDVFNNIKASIASSSSGLKDDASAGA